MAAKPYIKVKEFAKDLDMKSKEITDILTQKGVEVKIQKALEPHEFDILFDSLTLMHQIEGIDDYIDGVTTIPSRLKDKPVTEKEEGPSSVAATEAETDKKEISEKTPEKTPEKTLEKTPEKTNDTVKSHAESREKTNEEKTSAKVSTEKEEEQKEQKSPVVAETEGVAVPVAGNSAQSEKEIYEDSKEQEEKAKKAAIYARVAAIEKAAQEKAQARAMKNDGKDVKNDNRNQGRVDKNDRPDKNQTQKDRSQERPFDKPKDKSQFDRFSRTPGGASSQPQNNKAPSMGQGRPQNNQFGGVKDNKDAFKGKNNQKQSYNQGRSMMDKEDYVPSAPKEKFQVQPIIRAQTPKGADGTSKKGGTRVVDMRTSSVDLSKYDEKLDSFVSESERDMRGGNQKLKKQQNQTRQETNIKQKNNIKKNGKNNHNAAPVKKAPLNVQIPEELTVSELAAMLKVTVAEVIKRLMLLGMMVTANQTIDYDTAAIVAEELGAVPSKAVVVTIEEKLFDDHEDSAEELEPRAPVVCVMGHVDHGKTSLLDAIRHTNVTVGEAGGITQHIGAYRVKINGQDITFLDTPGHEAFTAMRARGAQATDIAVLVVAADDGIMPQTIEAINHAKAAGVDIIVAINKMDKIGANPDNVKQELTKYDLVPEEWGGDVICVPVSALTKQGIDDLLENILLVAEVKELKANPNRLAKGIVIEAKLDKGKGPVATVLVQNGTLHNGDIVIAGTAVGRVRVMTDHNGRTVKSAAPSVPVEIVGLAEVPVSGDEFAAVENERMARELADKRRNEAKEAGFKANARANLNDLFAQISEGVKELNIIIKADVGGSAEAVRNSLEKLSNDEVKVRVIHSAAGGITEGDVMFAAASNAIIVGFNVRPDKAALDSAERQEVEIRTYRIIYQCIEEIEAAMKGMLAPKYKETLLGHAEVRQTIHVPNVGTIAGSYVTDGKITRSSLIRVVRDGVVIFEDKISSLRRFKDDVKEVAQGYECGIGLEKFNDIRVSDVLEAFIMEEVER